MRLPPALVVAALLAAALPASAQPPTFDHAYQVRGAYGDIPTTAAGEPGGSWNVEQRLAVAFATGSEAQHTVHLPPGARLVNATCTPCNTTVHEETATSVRFTIGAAEATGTYTLTVLTSQGAGPAVGFSVVTPSGVPEDQRIAILYVPADMEVEAPQEPTSPGLSTDGSARILVFEAFDSMFWAALHEQTTGVDAPEDSDGGGLSGWLLPALVGLLLGIVLWALLVSRGVVQAKSRRQVAATAAHVEAAQADPPAVLEGKKRALLAALKDIEVAKMNSEMPPEVYDAVKADLKRQAVTVMRALETSQKADDAKA